MLLPQHGEWVNRLIAECKLNPDVSQWWAIGMQMHTITDDYKILYDYKLAKPELDVMWDAWVKSDPRGQENATD